MNISSYSKLIDETLQSLRRFFVHGLDVPFVGTRSVPLGSVRL